MLTEEQFSHLAKKYMDTVFRLAFNYTKSQTEADDVTQEVLIKLYRTDKEFESEKHIKHWIIRVTINECKKVLISPWKKHTVPLEEYAGEVFDRKEESDLFLAVMSLPKKYRIVVHLYYYEDYSVREIAEILSRKETTVQTQLMRARQKLKEQLKEAWNDAE